MSIKSILGFLFSKFVVWKNSFWKKSAVKYQERWLKTLLSKAKNTEFGVDHNFDKISNYADWKKNVPITNYEGLRPYIEKIKDGKPDVLWSGVPLYFCKTSGTTSGTKFIPITKESIVFQLKAARDSIMSYVNETGASSILDGKMLFLQGSPKLNKVGKVLTGRLSGIVAHHVPSYLLKNRVPTMKVNYIEDWDKKVSAIVDETINKKMTLISGIPPWVQMYFEKIASKTGKTIKEVFPNFNLFIYGGVNFSPYKRSFEKLIGGNVGYVELYPASEGFIAYQDSQNDKGMLLCVNHGIFYEFIEVEKYNQNIFDRISLSSVKIGVNYVVILNTNAGLWGYNIGDTVKFVSTNPYRVVVTGRVAHYTSAFGEHVIAEEVENAMKKTLLGYSVIINEFHVAPEVNPIQGGPFHEWFIEFKQYPKNMSDFARDLNQNLCNLNVYYKDLIEGGVLECLKITAIQDGGFNKYMSSIGKLGGQNKTPRLSNDRKVADMLNEFKST